jgi:hypothetical protein
MMKATRDVPAEAVLQSASHVLFVEGSGKTALDPTVLEELVGQFARVVPMGPSFHIASAAQALAQYHPTYYFLIDRDHLDDTTVEVSWSRFPDPKTNNLLIWRKRELENYFIAPEYAAQSEFLSVSESQLQDRILAACRRRFYMDVVNLVIIRIREELKQNWVETFNRVSDFRTRDEALSKLLELPAFPNRKKVTSKAVDRRALKILFKSRHDEFTGGTDSLEYGSGRWLDLIRGKDVFQSIAGNCFQVRDSQGRLLQGKAKFLQIAKSLTRLPIERQPADFSELCRLLERRVKQTTP